MNGRGLVGAAGRAAVLAGASLVLAGCMSGSGTADGGSTLSNLFRYGGPTEPPVAPVARIDVADCPPVGVVEGGSSLKVGNGQISISNVARQCTGREDGAVVVKVGVEGRALLGPGGSSGRFEAPVTIIVKRGDQVLATRTRRAAVTVGAGQTSDTFAVVEDNIVVPPGTGEFDIDVSLAGVAARPAAAASRRRSRS